MEHIMIGNSRNGWLPMALAAAVVAGSGGASAQGLAPPRATPLPQVTGPIAVTPDSHPFMTASRLLEPVDLAAAGYVEEEFFVSGRANVYEWASDGGVTVKTPDAPYTTRILVRRPQDPARFSGNVIVEIMHAPFGQDFGLMWGWAHDYFLERRDAWVGVTVMPAAVRALKTFDPVRYAPISFANPAPSEPCAAEGGDPDPSMEEGLRWDIISQVGALLKRNAAGGPLAGLDVRHLYQTTQNPIQLTYINAIHRHARLQSGAPVYDGYVVKGGARAARISRCSAQPAADDPRNRIQNVGVPVIHLQMQGDLPGALGARRADSDAPGDRFRLWEIAGTAHFDSAGYRKGFASMTDMVRGGLELPVRVLPPELNGFTFPVPFHEPGAARCQPETATEQPVLAYLFHSAFANIDSWVRRGVPPPRAARLEVEHEGTPQARVALDEFGNGRGGVRTPHVDVPIATYHAHHAGNADLCRQFGYEERFSWSRLASVYGSFAVYGARVNESIDRAVRERWLTEADGRKVRLELVGPEVAARSGETGGRR